MGGLLLVVSLRCLCACFEVAGMLVHATGSSSATASDARTISASDLIAALASVNSRSLAVVISRPAICDSPASRVSRVGVQGNVGLVVAHCHLLRNPLL